MNEELAVTGDAAMPPIVDSLPDEETNLFDRSIVLSLKTNGIGIIRTINTDALEVEADKSMLHLTKELIKSEELKAIWKLDASMRLWLKSRSMQPRFFHHGTYLVPLASLANVNAKIKTYVETERPALVKALVAAWDEILVEAKNGLKEWFNRGEYLSKEEVARQFTVDYKFYRFPRLDKSEGVDPAIYKEQMAIAEIEVREATEEVKTMLRTSLAELTDKLYERLTAEEDEGKKKTLRKDAFNKLAEFLDAFNAKNIVNDTALAAVVDRMRGVMSGLTIEAVKNSEELQARLAENIGAVKTDMDKLVELKPTRKLEM